MTTQDTWFVDENAELAEIRDENRLLVATAHDFDEAREIVREHNAHAGLLAALLDMVQALDSLSEQEDQTALDMLRHYRKHRGSYLNQKADAAIAAIAAAKE